MASWRLQLHFPLWGLIILLCLHVHCSLSKAYLTISEDCSFLFLHETYSSTSTGTERQKEGCKKEAGKQRGGRIRDRYRGTHKLSVGGVAQSREGVTQ